jgi:hypothetical protein
MRKERKAKKREYVSISFPHELIDAITLLIRHTGYKNPTDYATFKLRLCVKEDIKKLNGKDATIRERLHSMGYKDE